jgi:pimeloyl-ACP methyl ester carboxylesterase
VVAPDHDGNTLFDELDGTGAELDTDTLAIRAADIRFVLDVMLDVQRQDVPESLRDKLDPDRVGVFGHSFGGVTAGLVLQVDPRPRAGLAIASPMENPLLEGVEIDVLDKPIGFLVAVEDNSITELGNVFIRRNFEDARVPAWKAEVADAGHWSFSDICGVTDLFAAGCGMGERQTDLTPFEYLPVATGKAIAQAYVTAFFRAHLDGDEGARLYLAQARPAEQLLVELRND